MVASPYYDRLRAVADLSHFDLFEAIDFTVARVNLNKARELVGQVQANPGISGDVKKAIGERLQKDIDAFDLHEKNIEKLRESHNRARGFMMEAKKFCESLSPDLLSPAESGLRDVTKMVSWMGITLPVEKYLDEVEGQKNAEREKLAKQALDTMNRQLHHEGSSPTLPRENLKSIGDPSFDSQASKDWNSNLSSSRSVGGPGGGPGGGAGSSPLAPAAGLGAGLGAGAAAPIAASQVGKLMPGNGGVLRPTPVDGGTLTPSPGNGGKVSTTPGFPSPGKGGAPGTGISPEWPGDALKYPIGGKVTSDGPVGGYTPAPVSDINDPRWRSDFTHPALGGANATKASGIVGGLVGSGAGALAARGAGGVGVGGATGMGGMMMPPGMGAGSAGVAGARGTGAVSGSTRGSARASSSAATARNSAMRPGAGGMGMAGGHGAVGARGGSKDEKKNRNLIGYQVVRIEDDEAIGPVDSSAFGAGDVSSLKPMKSEESDKW